MSGSETEHFIESFPTLLKRRELCADGWSYSVPSLLFLWKLLILSRIKSLETDVVAKQFCSSHCKIRPNLPVCVSVC